MSEADYDQMNDNTKKIYLRERDQYLAIFFLLGGTLSKYSQLVADLQNSYILGEDKHPKYLEEAYDMMLSYSPLIGTNSTNDRTTKESYTTGISFYQANKTADNEHNQTNIIPGSSRKTFENVKCFACDNMGRYANDCPLHQTKSAANNHQKATKGFSFTKYEYSLSHAECFQKL